MQAIRVAEYGASTVMKYVQLHSRPTIQSNELLVRNHAVGVNFIDTYQRTGLYPVSLPFTLGREGAGIVDQVGEEVKHFKKGDRVAYLAQGAYADYTAVSSDRALIIPNEISFEIAAAALLQGMTALVLTHEAVQVKKGDFVLVQAAAGGMGLLLSQICSHLGATVIGTVSNEEKASLAKSNGVEYTIDYSKEQVPAKVNEITKGQGVQIAFDGVGQFTFDSSLRSLGKRGHFISYGNASGKVPPVDLLVFSKNCIKFQRPSLFEYISTEAEFEKISGILIKMLLNKELNIQIFKKYKLSEAAAAHDDLEGRKTTGKLILIPDSLADK